MRHTNPNMVEPVLAGIAAGERAVSAHDGHILYAQQIETIAQLTPQLTPPGDRPFVVGGFLKAKAIAFAQGFVAAYRTGTER